MKLLFDQNISFRIKGKIASEYQNSTQVREVGLENATDKEIWEYAKVNDYVIVTFDSDFYDGMHLTPTGLKKLINHKIKNY